MVIGDFNGRIGSQRTGEENIIGKFGYGRRSKNGERMIKMALENNLAFMNSFFRKDPKKKWTWLSPDGSYKNEIDYIATNKKMFSHDINILNQFNFSTNHRIVRAEINITEPKKSRNKYNAKANFINTQQQCFINTPKNEIEYKYNNEIKEIYGPLFNKSAKPKTTYTENDTKTLIEERRKLLKLGKDKENLRAISKLSKKISNSIKNDRTKKRTNVLNYHINKTGGVKKALKELIEAKKWIPNIKNKAGTQQTTRKAIIQTATNFYRKLYATERNTRDLTINLDSDDMDEDIPVFLQSEIEKAVNSQKNNKAPGPDQISNEMIKISIRVPEKLRKLTEIYNSILSSECIPSQWTKSTIILLHKKGDRNIIENYRPINKPYVEYL